MKLGEYIKKYRADNGMTLVELAKKTGLTHAYLSMLENNKNSRSGKPIVPTLQTVAKVANAVGLSLETMLETIDDFPVTVTPKLVELSDEATLVAAAYDEADPELQSMVRRLLNVKKSTLSRLG